jgi:hypothetical protein
MGLKPLPGWLADFLTRHPRIVNWLSRYYAWRNERVRRNHKCKWRCYRDGGGGLLITPRAMTQDRAVAWLNRITGGEVFYVDFEHRFIFYRTADQLRRSA